MKTDLTNSVKQFLNVSLGDDDHQFFREAIEDICIDTKLSLFEDGDNLMDYLNHPKTNLPDVIFLDFNMPVKNGMQCLREIRSSTIMDRVLIAIF